MPALTFRCEQSAEDTPRAYCYVNVIHGTVQLSGWFFTEKQPFLWRSFQVVTQCLLPVTDAITVKFQACRGRAAWSGVESALANVFPGGKIYLLIIRCSLSNPLVHSLTYSTAQCGYACAVSRGACGQCSCLNVIAIALSLAVQVPCRTLQLQSSSLPHAHLPFLVASLKNNAN